MTNGRRGIAPCGHEGEYVVGQYVACPACDHADAVTDGVDFDLEETTNELPRCPHCGSLSVEDFDTGGFFGYAGIGAGTLHCIDCGRVFRP